MVKLAENERAELEKITHNPQEKVRKAVKAKALLTMDEGREGGDWNDQQICQAFGLSRETVFRMRRQFVKEECQDVLSRRPYPQEIRQKLDRDKGAKLMALCASAPPEDRKDWSLRLLADRAVELGIVESIPMKSAASP